MSYCGILCIHSVVWSSTTYHFMPPLFTISPPLSTTLLLFYPISGKVSTILADFQKFLPIFCSSLSNTTHNHVANFSRQHSPDNFYKISNAIFSKKYSNLLRIKMDQHTLYVPVHFCTKNLYFYFFFTVMVLLFVVPVESFTVIVTL